MPVTSADGGEAPEEGDIAAKLAANETKLRAAASAELACFGDISVLHIEGGLWGLDLDGHLTGEAIAGALRAVFNDPRSGSGWAMIPVATPRTTYEPSVREVYRLRDLVPAVCVAAVSPRVLHRVMIAALSLPVRAVTGTVLTAHTDFDEALSVAREGLVRRRARTG
jgi:hypothetical protein